MLLSMEIYTLAQKFGDFKAAEMIKKAGFDAIDYSFYLKNECEEVLGEGYLEYAKKMKAHLDKTGLICNQAHAPFTFTYGMNADVSEERYLYIVRSMEAAAILGAKNIVIHSVTVPDDVNFEEYNITYYKSFIPYCEKFGINIAVENLFKRDANNNLCGKIGCPEELNRIIEKIGSPYAVACVDTGHAALTGYEPEDFIAGMNSDCLKVLHISDNTRLRDNHDLPYLGALNWKEIMTSLKKIGYSGELTFEINWFLPKFPDALIESALNFAYSVGKHLISIFENK